MRVFFHAQLMAAAAYHVATLLGLVPLPYLGIAGAAAAVVLLTAYYRAVLDHPAKTRVDGTLLAGWVDRTLRPGWRVSWQHVFLFLWPRERVMGVGLGGYGALVVLVSVVGWYVAGQGIRWEIIGSGGLALGLGSVSWLAGISGVNARTGRCPPTRTDRSTTDRGA